MNIHKKKISCSYIHCSHCKPKEHWWNKSKKYGTWLEKLWFCSHSCFSKQMLVEWETWKSDNSKKQSPTNRLRLGLILVDMGVMTPEELKSAVEKQKELKNARLGVIIRQMGYATEKDITIALSKQYHASWIELNDTKISPNLIKKIPKKIITDALILPFEYDKKENKLSLAMANPGDFVTIQIIRKFFQCDVQPFAVDESAICGIIARVLKDTCPISPTSVLSIQNRKILTNAVNTILSPDLRNKLSNLNIESVDNALLIRFEINKVNCDCFISVPQ
ncbi:MAG: hypothetical protein A2161_10790 [Candidatus Schekmanbacteria bacterium RBG_13_48_7]|uniref:Type II secretion system protein GspE N-terminal domain-containing protein n=1 Tax=Candidatus Schekmanbacteria bacterium RBG_13_48_7 TaxID=1817878 RepID=A0A1F7RPL7_9BACT|nr:MAG: hypothetical protein A2161_10790 [Candidatus Schekmanbacteria bacterium RBG_13_48_7]